MTLVRRNDDLERWFDASATSWDPFDDRQYKAIVAEWRSLFESAFQNDAGLRSGRAALDSLMEEFPADVVVFSGLRVPRFANMGGSGPCGYSVTSLSKLDRSIANSEEVVVMSAIRKFSCVFTHEAEALAAEAFLKLSDAV